MAKRKVSDAINPEYYVLWTHEQLVDLSARAVDRGVQVIDVIETAGLNFNIGTSIPYLLRAGRKPQADTLEDLRKARWYIDREIQTILREMSKPKRRGRKPGSVAKKTTPANVTTDVKTGKKTITLGSSSTAGNSKNKDKEVVPSPVSNDAADQVQV
jgi:hypothetical protein